MKNISQDYQDRRIRLAEAMLEIEEESVIFAIEKLVSATGVKRPEESLSIEEIHARLDEALQDVREGRYTQVEDLLEEIKTW